MVPENLKYTKKHEWVRVEDGEAVIGITEYAARELGDVVFVELPEEGDPITQFEPLGTVEAVKAVSDIYAPVSGEVIEVNEALEAKPETVNQSPYEEGWMVRVRLEDETELEELLSPQAYNELIE